MGTKFFLAFLLIIATLISIPKFTSGESTTQPAAQPKIRVLIIDGFSNHDWQQTTRLLRGILVPTSLFDVSVSTSPPTAASPGWDQWRPKFSDFDVVIQTCWLHLPIF